MSAVQVSKLSNGITVATERFEHVESVALGVWIKSGARNETLDEHGIAHLLEHMAFKGTYNRSAEQIAVEIEDVGGEINASTSVETTAYYARVLKDNVPLAVDILSDILMNSRFDPVELEREQHVIIQEIGAAHDTPDDIVFDHFTETAYAHQSIGRSILGTPSTVQSFTSEHLHSYIKRQYTGERTVIVGTGAIDHDEFVREVESRFGTMAAQSKTSEVASAHYVGGEFREMRDLMDAQIMIGFEGRAYHARDSYASQLLASILGGGMSSRLFQEVRERRGLCYSVYAFHWGFSDTGLFGIHAATGQEDVRDLAHVLGVELNQVANEISQSEVDRARSQFRATMLMAGENVASRAGQIARQLQLFGRSISTEELMDRLQNITPQRLTDLARRTFVDSSLTLAGIGPIADLPTGSEIHATLSSQARPGQLAV